MYKTPEEENGSFKIFLRRTSADFYPSLYYILLWSNLIIFWQVWDVRTKACVHTLVGHTNTIADVRCQGVEPQVTNYPSTLACFKPFYTYIPLFLSILISDIFNIFTDHPIYIFFFIPIFRYIYIYNFIYRYSDVGLCYNRTYGYLYGYSTLNTGWFRNHATRQLKSLKLISCGGQKNG